jgi:hypothetical protein
MMLKEQFWPISSVATALMVQSGPDGRVRQLARLLLRLHLKVNDQPSKIS